MLIKVKIDPLYPNDIDPAIAKIDGRYRVMQPHISIGCDPEGDATFKEAENALTMYILHDLAARMSERTDYHVDIDKEAGTARLTRKQ
jgi:hypothetical protein